MKKVFVLILIISFFGINANSQSKEVRNALKTGKNSKGYYVAKGPFKVDDFKSWYSSNSNSYILIDYSAYERVKYGSYVSEVDWFGFVPLSEYDSYKAQKLREARRTRKFSGGKVIAAVGLFAIGIKALQSISSSSSSSSSSGDYSSGSDYSNDYSSSSENETEEEKPSSSDLRNGKINIPSYDIDDEWDWGCGCKSVEFADDTEGRIFKNEKGIYLQSMGINFYYSSEYTAIKALYIYKKYNVLTHSGSVD